MTMRWLWYDCDIALKWIYGDRYSQKEKLFILLQLDSIRQLWYDRYITFRWLWDNCTMSVWWIWDEFEMILRCLWDW